MSQAIAIRELWRDTLTVLRRGWRAVLVTQFLCKAAAIFLLAPLTVAVINALLGESASIGNVALVRFALSPLGVIAIVLLPTIALAGMLFEQALMVSLIHDACDRPSQSLGDAVAITLWRLPRLAWLALIQVIVAILIIAPFLALAGLTYWLLLSGSDINFYLATRPPRFIAALAIGGILALVAAAVLIAFYCRAFLSVPAVLFQSLTARAALRESARLSHGRRHEVIWAAVSWVVLRIIALTLGLLLLRGLVWLILSHRSDDLLTTLWLIAGLILFAAVAFAVAAALDRAALATVVTLLYRRLTDPSTTLHVHTAPAPRSRRRALLLTAAVLIALAVTATHTIALVGQFTQRHRVTVTAHRAGAIRAPENSLAALRQAIAERADAAEIDVQRSSDGVVMVIHDRDLMRVAKSPLVVATATADQLHAAGISTLDEFIDAARDKIGLSIELKYYGRGDVQLADSVVRTLKAKDFLAHASIISLEYSGLVQTRKLEPRLPLGFLVSASLGDLTKLDIDFLSVSTRSFTPKLRRQADERGLPIAVWTVNDRNTIVRMIARGADDLVTDDPALAVEAVRWYRELSDAELILLRFREWLAG